MPAADVAAPLALAATQAWVDRAVVGLNLCPFAKAVQARRQLRLVCCAACDEHSLLAALGDEMKLLRDTPVTQIETTLLVHPWVLNDFGDYNQFLDDADALLESLDLQGVLQLASFHPQYQFAGTSRDDITNATNRSPFPTLHLLRESSVERAVAAFPDAAQIYATNLRTLQALGPQAWAALQAQCLRDASGGIATGD